MRVRTFKGSFESMQYVLTEVTHYLQELVCFSVLQQQIYPFVFPEMADGVNLLAPLNSPLHPDDIFVQYIIVLKYLRHLKLCEILLKIRIYTS